MRKRMMRIRDTDLGVRLLVSRASWKVMTRDVALKGQLLEVEHQPGMVGAGGGARRRGGRDPAADSPLFQPRPFECDARPHGRCRVLRQPNAVAGPEFALELVESLEKESQQAGAALEGGAAFSNCRPRREVLEHDTRVGLGVAGWWATTRRLFWYAQA